MEKDNEIWRYIPGVPNYQASNLGNIRSVRGEKYKVLKQFSNKVGDDINKQEGYLCVTISQNGFSQCKTVHSLVCAAWHPKPTNKGAVLQVNHKSEMKWEDSADNLEWVTPSENCLWGSKPMKMRNAKIKRLMAFKDGEIEPYFWDSVGECCAAFNTYHNKLQFFINGEFNPQEEEKKFKDIQGNFWAIYEVYASYDSDGNLTWESPSKRKEMPKTKPYSWLDELTPRTVGLGGMLPAELPRDEEGNIRQATPCDDDPLFAKK